MAYFRAHQLNIMLVLCGTCGVLAILAMLTNALSFKRRCLLAFLEASAALLLLFDRFAYIYRGSLTSTGFWMVRISNFMVFFIPLCMAYGFTRYLCDLFGDEARRLTRIRICDGILCIGAVLLIVSQFTGLYYTFDAQNIYHRSPGNPLSFLIPILIMLIQFSVIVQFKSAQGAAIRFSLMLYTLLPVAAGIIQLFVYGISLVNLTVASVTALLYVYALIDMNHAVEHARLQELEFYKEGQRRDRALFEQTAGALVNAIDAKDRYTNGHSQRVAEYSRQIAKDVGKTDDECDAIYFAALLHDVGKIGIPIAILNKNGRLTEKEFTQIKQHPVIGGQILASIQQAPALSIAARYHHERYDGRGYPEGLKGDSIPEIARIIAVADAYDAMSSNRSYRKAIPQHIVREELVKGNGTQFDPEFARAMLHLLDLDTEYHMREMEAGSGLSPETVLHCEEIYHDCTDGIPVTDKMIHISLSSQEDGMPSLILFDSLDAKVHPGEESNKDVLYFEYALIRFDGHIDERGTRKVETKVVDRQETAPHSMPGDESRFDIEAVRYRDQALVRVIGSRKITQIILALPDSTRFTYLSITGEHCSINRLRVEVDDRPVRADYIPRIAEEISFIRDCPEGNIPNVQVDGWRSDATEGIPLTGDMTLAFHSMSLPTARLVWHCPFISVFTSKDGRINGEGFREFMLLRLDGENWESDAHVENKVQINRSAGFVGWDEWKEKNRQGLDCTARIQRRGRTITIKTENLGIALSSVTTVLDNVDNIYVALTGDQVALTNIRVSHDR